MKITHLLLLILLFSLVLAGCGRTPIGGQTDEHGCMIAAGYSWCELKEKCVRTWEEYCPEEEFELEYIEIVENYFTENNQEDCIVKELQLLRCGEMQNTRCGDGTYYAIVSCPERSYEVYVSNYNVTSLIIYE